MVHGNTTHPAVGSVGSAAIECLRLADAEGTSRRAAAQIVEANRRAIRRVGCSIDRVGHHQRLAGAEIAIAQTEHQAIFESVKAHCSGRLRHHAPGGGGAWPRVKRRHGQRAASPFGERGVGGRREVNLEIKNAQLIGRVAKLSRLEVGERRWCARGRQRQPIQAARQHAANAVGAVDTTRREQHCRVKVDKTCRRIADQHLGTVKRKHARLLKRRTGLVELVVGHVVAIGPQAELRIVVELVVRHLEVVQVVRASRVGRLRDGNELVIVGVRQRAELADQPAIGELVVQHDRIAVVRRTAGA